MSQDFSYVPVVPGVSEEDGLVGVFLERPSQRLSYRRFEYGFRESSIGETWTDLLETLFRLIPLGIHHDLFLSLPFPPTRSAQIHPPPTLFQDLLESRVDAGER